MKKYFKRVKAILMAAMITLGAVLPAMPVMADEAAPTTTFIISGIEPGSEVHAYAIALDAVDASGNHYWKYNPAGSVEMKVQDWLSTGKLSSDNGIYLYTHLNSSMESDNHDGKGEAVVDETVLVGSETSTPGTFQITGVKAGLYVITAAKAEGTVSYNYNIYPANYQYDASGNAYLPATMTYVVKKTSEPNLEKTVVKSDVKSKHGDASIGDTVDFNIEITVPAYSDEWNVDGTHFVISDTLTSGLALKTDSVKIEGTSIATYSKECSSTTFTTSESGFTLDLHGKDIYNYRGQTINVTYQATVTSDAKVNFDRDLNKATIRWSNTPGSDDLSAPKESKTYHYTFGIDTFVNGSGSTQTTEVTKYGIKTTTVEDNKVLLDGAEFQILDASKNVLYFDDNGKLDPTKTKNNHITSKNGGKLTATGLGAGTYYLKESKAPLGYALDKTEYKVVITPTYDELTGELKNYSVQIGDGGTNSLTFKYEKNDAGNIIFSNDGTFAINNTPMIKLPETGGVGIVVVTVVAVVMMAAFGSVFIALGKKKRTQ